MWTKCDTRWHAWLFTSALGFLASRLNGGAGGRRETDPHSDLTAHTVLYYALEKRAMSMFTNNAVLYIRPNKHLSALVTHVNHHLSYECLNMPGHSICLRTLQPCLSMHSSQVQTASLEMQSACAYLINKPYLHAL